MEGNGEPSCKIAKNETHPYHRLKNLRVLNELKDKKSVFIHAEVEQGDGDAVVILEKKPFDTSEKSLASLLSEETKLVQDISNDIYSTYCATPEPKHGAFKTTMIYPATAKHIEKYKKQDVDVVEETYDDYKNITLPLLKGENKFSVQWVFNILDKKTESERIVYEDSDPETGFILLPDMKWDISDLSSLYLIALPHNRGIKSLRDLTADHLPLLRNILLKSQEAIMEKYSIPKKKLRIYTHYQPSYYHFHIHFTHIDFDAPGSAVTRAHLLSDIIENIELVGDYYQKKTMTFVGRKSDKLTIALSDKKAC